VPLIESALAFAITMLVLSLIVSSLVELIHRVLSMREAGLQYMLGQMFEQVLAKYVLPPIEAEIVKANPAIDDATKNKLVQEKFTEARNAFVARMSANRAPMGVTPDATPANNQDEVKSDPWWRFGLWNGRKLSAMTPKEFMERLGTIDIGVELVKANAEANDLAKKAGGLAADAADAVLKDVAQKFEAFGKEAGTYFEGRARLLSVGVAIALAFFAHVDAVDLFRTYLSDPNVRQKTIEQAQTVTAQYKAAEDAAKAVRALAPPTAATPEEVRKQVEQLQKDWQKAIGNVNTTVTQYQDLGVPIGWTKERIKAAEMWPWLWTCTELAAGVQSWLGTLRQDCRPAEGEKSYQKVWFQVPTVLSVYVFLALGGLLIGLGSPFWYNAVTGLTNIRNVARDVTGAGAAQTLAAQQEVPKQPVTPAGTFAAALTARAAAPVAAAAPTAGAPSGGGGP